jgi:hypothetical protein
MTNAYERMLDDFHGPSDLIDYCARTSSGSEAEQLRGAIRKVREAGFSWAQIWAAIKSLIGSLNWLQIITTILGLLIPLMKEGKI